MKRLVTFGIALIALAVSGWSNASSLDIPELCGNLGILKDPENRVYRGWFKGGGTELETALVVTPITLNRDTLVFYVWGKQPVWRIQRAGCRFGTGAKKADTLTINWKGLRVTYKYSGDKATVKYKRGGNTTKGKVTLSEM